MTAARYHQTRLDYEARKRARAKCRKLMLWLAIVLTVLFLSLCLVGTWAYYAMGGTDAAEEVAP